MKKKTAVFLVCYLAYVSIYVARINLSIAAPSLKESAYLTTAQIGTLGGVFSVVYACGRLLCGRIGDRIQPWLILCVSLLFCGAFNLICGTLPTFAALLILWGLNALAQSMLWGPLLRVIAATYEPAVAKKRAAYLSSAVATGNIAGILVSSLVIKAFGNTAAFLIPGGFVCFMAVPVLLLTKNIRCETRPAPAAKTAAPTADGINSMLLPALFHGAVKDSVSLWMAVYLLDRFGLETEQSMGYMLLIPALGFVGRILTPGLHERCGSDEKKLMKLSFLACAAVAILLAVLPGRAVPAAVALSFIYMATSAINTCLLSIFPMRFAASGRVADVSGRMDFASYLGHGLSSLAYGLLIEKAGYEAMFAVWAAFSLGAVLLLRKKKNA